MIKTVKKRFLKKALILFLLTFTLIFGIILYIDIKMRPLIKPIALSQAKALATRTINEAVNEEIQNLDIRYDDLITFEKDNNNRINALKANTIMTNDIKAKLTVAVLNKIAKIKDATVRVPLGNLINGELFSNRGPRITVKLIPVGYVTSNIINSFQEAGINQTRHSIILEVKATIGIILPTSVEYAEVVTGVTVAETVLVGDVPDSYTHVTGDDQGIVGKINDYADK